MANDSVGWMWNLRYSPTADHVALHWNQRPSGIWVVSLRDSSQSLLLRGGLNEAYAVGWCADGGSVYVMKRDSGEILRVPLTGDAAAVVATLPFEVPESSAYDFSCWATEREAGLTLLCTVPESVSDAWMVENFDPDIR